MKLLTAPKTKSATDSTHPFLFAMYGTFRRNQPWFKQLSDPVFERSAKLRGYKLYDAGAYPFALQSKEPLILVVDILRLNHEDAEIVSRIERGAGYNLKLTKNQPIPRNDRLLIWIVPQTYLSRLKWTTPSIIKSGDWVKHISTFRGNRNANSSISE